MEVSAVSMKIFSVDRTGLSAVHFGDCGLSAGFGGQGPHGPRGISVISMTSLRIPPVTGMSAVNVPFP